MNIYTTYFIYFITFTITFWYSRKNFLPIWPSIVLASIIAFVVFVAISDEAEIANLPEGDPKLILNSILHIFTGFVILLYTIENIMKQFKDTDSKGRIKKS